MVTVADTRILDPNTGEVLAFPGDVLGDEQLYRLEMLAFTYCVKCFNTGLVGFERGRGWTLCDCEAGQRKAAQFDQAAQRDAEVFTAAMRGHYASIAG